MPWVAVVCRADAPGSAPGHGLRDDTAEFVELVGRELVRRIGDTLEASFAGLCSEQWTWRCEQRCSVVVLHGPVLCGNYTGVRQKKLPCECHGVAVAVYVYVCAQAVEPCGRIGASPGSLFGVVCPVGPLSPVCPAPVCPWGSAAIPTLPSRPSVQPWEGLPCPGPCKRAGSPRLHWALYVYAGRCIVAIPCQFFFFGQFYNF
jgi:hypothetical protein